MTSSCLLVFSGDTTTDWIFGFLLQKIFVGVCLVAPVDWGWREIVTNVHRNGEPQLRYTIGLCLKVVQMMSVSWAVPYVIAYGIVPVITSDLEILEHIQHTIYPTILFLILGIAVAKWNMGCFKTLCDSIKQRRYLVGNQLINNEEMR
jgi:E3 ubiquitin-protein ligase MARCH6